MKLLPTWGEGMSRRYLCGAVCLCLLLPSHWALAQQSTQPRGTLPPVEVVPEDQPEAEPTISDQGPSSPFDRPFSFPSLSDQSFGDADFGGLDGIMRSNRSLFDMPGLGTIVDRQQLGERMPVDMFHALQNEVGVLMQATARGQASPFVRGLTGQQVLILVDGVRLNNSTFRAGPNQYFNLIDPGQVERVEVLRGPQSVLWGSDALGGVINVVTRSAAPHRGNYTGGSFVEYFSTADTGSYSRGNVEGWVGSSGLFAGGSYLNVNNLDRGGSLGRQPFTDYQQYAGDIKYNFMVDDEQMMTVAFQHFEQQNLPRSDRFAPFVLGPPANTPRPTFFDPQRRDLVYLRWQGLAHNALFDAFTTTVSYGRQQEGSLEIRNPANDVRDAQFVVNTFGSNVALSKDLDCAGRLTYGVDYYYDDVNAFRNRRNPTVGTITRLNPQFPDDATYDRVGGFVNWDVDLTERLTTIAGVRYENVNASGTIDAVSGGPKPFKRTYQDWIGSVGWVYEINPYLNFVGGVSEGFRAPNLDDLTADNTVLQTGQDSPSLNVQPEHSINYEVGLKIETPRLRMQVVEFWTDLDNNIQRQNVGGNNFVRANFDSYINGTELTGEYLFEGGWSAYGNFWYIYGRDKVRQEPISRIPPTQGIAGLRWRDECHRSWFDVYTWLVRRQDRYAAQNLTDSRFPVGGTPGYGTLNLRTGTTLGRCDNHRLSLTLENITDKAYRVFGSGVDGPGFNAILGYEHLR
jgi:hemoglobin/transferrin/lactoferrin receptor protein